MSNFGALESDQIDRIRMIERIYVMYPRLNELFELIAECHEDSKTSAEPQCMFLTGWTGVGKTSLIEQYLIRCPRKDESDHMRVPVFHAEIPAKATVKSLATALLDSLGDPAPERGNTVAQGQRLAHLIKRCGVELILLDEFQHLIDNKTKRVVLDVSDWIKYLINSTKVPMILIGMPESEAILEANPQLKRRFMVRKSLAPFSWRTEDDRLEFRRFLALVEKMLPFDTPSQLADVDLAFPIYIASQGTAANVMTLIKQAARFAIREGEEKLDSGHFARAYERRNIDGDDLPQNPFTVQPSVIMSWPMVKKDLENPLGVSNRIRAKSKQPKASEVLRKA
ncbi:AAA family ATPase [Acidithiobacillus ferriphilus]|uniref:TniB family NTP-binding protein n=1 Tax=Acidithiobacillus ferriphilus TaxID=1689834 RepID=UPI001C06F3E6|nr:TniB family NTP-binding protein [Acidithiobacillus ferriphilus]MBU2847293.1 AAA family ATPase [Acidithiobacillus ferriphilus]